MTPRDTSVCIQKSAVALALSWRRFVWGALFLGLVRLCAAADDLDARLQSAIAAGDLVAQREPTASFRDLKIPPADLPAATLVRIGIALQTDNPSSAVPYFFAACKDAKEYPRASFWLGEIAFNLGDRGYAHRLAAEMDRKAAGSPATAYLHARITLSTARDMNTQDPDYERCWQEFRDAYARWTSLRISYADYEPRWATLAIDKALAEKDLLALARAYERFYFYRRDNLINIRHIFALEIKSLGDFGFLADAKAALPADEVARWEARAAAAAVLPREDLAHAAFNLQLAEQALGTGPGAADLAPAALFLIQRAACSLPFGDPPPRRSRLHLRARA